MRVMRNAAATLLLLLTLGGTAAAATIHVRPAGAITATSSGALTFTGGEVSMRCNVTLTGTLLSEFRVAAGTTEATIGTARSASCSGGEIRSFLALPWSLRYETLLGTPPSSITGMLLTLGGSIAMSVFGGFVNCLYSGNFGMLARLILVPGSSPPEYEESFEKTLLTSLALALTSGALCPSTLRVAGTFNVSPRQTLTYS